MTKDELKPIDTSKYKITETGQVLKIIKEFKQTVELEEEYYANRPTEPYSEEDSPSSWANIAYYAEENLDKAFKLISELKNENAELKEKYAKECEDTMYIVTDYSKQLVKAKTIIRNCLNLWHSVMTEESERAIIREAELFLKE